MQFLTSNPALISSVITLFVGAIFSVIFRNLPSTSLLALVIREVFQSGWNYLDVNGQLLSKSEVKEKISKLLVVAVCLFTLLSSTACGAINANIATATATLSNGQTIQFQYCVVITDTAILASGAEMNCFTDSAQAALFAASIANVTDGSVTIIKSAKPRAAAK